MKELYNRLKENSTADEKGFQGFLSP